MPATDIGKVELALNAKNQIAGHFGQFPEGVKSVVRVHHGCSENSDATIWLPIGSGCDPRETGENRFACGKFASRYDSF